MKKIFLMTFLIVFCFALIKAQEQDEPFKQTPVNIHASCSMFVIGWDVKVFEDKETFNKAIAKAKLNCSSVKIPDVDFEKYTLIGVGTNVGNCKAGSKFDITISKDKEKKIYLVKTKIGYSPCRGISYTARWALVPKLPKDYKVEFIMEEEKDPYDFN